jgi:hypothetical protein
VSYKCDKHIMMCTWCMLKKLYLKTFSYVLREDSCAISVSHTGFFCGSLGWVDACARVVGRAAALLALRLRARVARRLVLDVSTRPPSCCATPSGLRRTARGDPMMNFRTGNLC